MNFSVLPPEINSARMFVGAGSGPLLEAAAAWAGLAAELGSAAASFGSVTSGMAGSSWQGPASTAMTAAAAPYAQWLSTAAAHAENTAGQAQAAATEFEAAQAATVHPTAVTANRALLVSLVGSNVFGLNAPAIAATDAEYEQMWAQDVVTMSGYHAGASTVAAQMTPMNPLQQLVGVVESDLSAVRTQANIVGSNVALESRIALHDAVVARNESVQQVSTAVAKAAKTLDQIVEDLR